jgi:hypothetical protein
VATNKKRIRVGHIVHCVFLDHAENAKDALRFEVFGRVTEITKSAYHIKAWGYVDEIDKAKDNNTDNENWFCIVKKAVESIRTLR